MSVVQKHCPNCDKTFAGHPNKKFCRPVCKDRFHNAQPHRAARSRQFDPRPVRHCDDCAKQGERTVATQCGASITHEGGVTFLCDDHAADWVHPFSEEAFEGGF